MKYVYIVVFFILFLIGPDLNANPLEFAGDISFLDFHNNYAMPAFGVYNQNPDMYKISYGFSLNNFLKVNKYEFKSKENLIRRSEVLFFGSLTFATFGGWLFFSIFNVLIYDDTFGKLRRDQFLILYLGSSVVSVSVVLSDLILLFKPKMKHVSFF